MTLTYGSNLHLYTEGYYSCHLHRHVDRISYLLYMVHCLPCEDYLRQGLLVWSSSLVRMVLMTLLFLCISLNDSSFIWPLNEWCLYLQHKSNFPSYRSGRKPTLRRRRGNCFFSCLSLNDSPFPWSLGKWCLYLQQETKTPPFLGYYLNRGRWSFLLAIFQVIVRA